MRLRRRAREAATGRPLRIVFVVGSLQIGGTEGQAARLAVELAALGHELHVVTLVGAGPRRELLDEAGIPVHVLDVPSVIERSGGRIRPVQSVRNALELASLVSYLRRVRPDVVQSFLLWPSAIGLTAAALARVPLRVSARRNLATAASSEQHPILVRLVDLASHHVIANSHAVVDRVRRRTPASVIPNGVELSAEAFDVGRQPARGVMVANLIAYKGHADLVRALAKLDEPPVVDCLGEGPERPNIEQLADALGVGEHIRLRGQVIDPIPILQQAQFAVLASHEEGLPNAVIESMAVGLPVIATAVGGVPELLADGVNGTLVPPHDVDALAQAIQRLCGDGAHRKTLGAAGRRQVASLSWPAVARAHERCYQALAGGEVVPVDGASDWRVEPCE